MSVYISFVNIPVAKASHMDEPKAPAGSTFQLLKFTGKCFGPKWVTLFTTALFIVDKRWKQSKCPWTGEWIFKMHVCIMEYFLTIKRRQYWYMLQYGRTSKTLFKVEESRHKGLHIVWVHLYEISWKGRSLETCNSGYWWPKVRVKCAVQGQKVDGSVLILNLGDDYTTALIYWKSLNCSLSGNFVICKSYFNTGIKMCNSRKERHLDIVLVTMKHFPKHYEMITW